MARYKGPTHSLNSGLENFDRLGSWHQKRRTWDHDDSPNTPSKSSKPSSGGRAAAELISDLWTEAPVIRQIHEIEQRMFRQGYRNNRDINGNEVYIATVEDKVKLFPDYLQAQAKRESEFIDELRRYAEPYQFGFSMDTYEYKLHIKNNETGSFATRKISRNTKQGNPPIPQDFQVAIDEMKSELETVAKTPAKLSYVDVKPAPKIVTSPDGKSLGVDAAKPKATDKRSGAGKIPTCPDHGNPMEPTPEPGVLKCPVLDCTKGARKKNQGAAFKKPEPPAVEDIESTNDDKAMEPFPAARQAAGEVMKNLVASTTDAFGQIKFPNGASLNFPNTTINLAKNDNPVRLFINNEGRMFLMQNDQVGNLVCIDITSARPQYTRRTSMLTETTVVLGLDQ